MEMEIQPLARTTAIRPIKQVTVDGMSLIDWPGLLCFFKGYLVMKCNP